MDTYNANHGDQKFGLQKHEIDEVVEAYNNKQRDEDLVAIEKFGGIKGLSDKLLTDPLKGISNDQESVNMRVRAFDNNYRIREPMPSFWFYVCDALGDTFLRILIGSAIVQISIGLSPLSENPQKDWIDSLAIIFAVIVIVLTASITNYDKEKKFKQLSEENFARIQVNVRRSGVVFTMSDEELLVGDIVKLEYGMIVPADGILISGNEFLIDESSLTGESDLIEKEIVQLCTQKRNKVLVEQHSGKVKLSSPILLSGTLIKAGGGWMMVLAVGKNSTGGKIKEAVRQNKNDEESSKTPLEIKLEEIAEDIGKFGLYAAIFTFLALFARLLYSKWIQYEYHQNILSISGNSTFNNNFTSNNSFDFNTTIYEPNATHHNHTTQGEHLQEMSNLWQGIYKEIFSIVILCIAIIVVAIPEGLPLAVTLALSFSVKKMMDDNCLVRRMHACETMGGANFICTDKTGTLTTNVLQVVNLYNNDSDVVLKERTSNTRFSKFGEKYYNTLKETIVSNIHLEVDDKNKVTGGSRTDHAFYDLFSGFGEDVKAMLDSNNSVMARINFNSDRKKMSTIVKKGSSYRIYMKGAPDIVIKACSHYIHPQTGEVVALNSNNYNKFTDMVRAYEVRKLRCIAVTYKDINQTAAETYKSNPRDNGSYELEESGFVLVGIAALLDELRPDVEKSVLTCNNAGINVIMVTGDSYEIAVAIARSANIIRQGIDYRAMKGPDFYKAVGGVDCVTCNQEIARCYCPRTASEAEARNMDESKLRKEKVRNMDEFKKIIKDLKVIARARPFDKYTLVLGLKELHNVVAVTGDGTNDAPALSKADVGFAMGQIGTDVARDAADIIILDDNFTSIVHAVKWGRNIFDNIRKFIQFQLSVNLSAVMLVFLSSCIGSESPISPIQMLWINLIMDSLGSLSLATEPPTEDLLHRKPHSKREYIITSRMWKHILIQSLIQFGIVFGLYLYAPYYIQETNPDRIFITKQIENCFGDFPGEKFSYGHHSSSYMILDGKKTSWSPLRRIIKNLNKDYCMFYDESRFEKGQIRNLYHVYKWYNTEYGNSVHMTIIFNTFVMYALFNQLNSRILDDKFNIFHKIYKNYLFVIIFLAEVGIQIAIVQYGGLIFRVSIGGLTQEQWAICVGLASTTLVVSFILKMINLDPVINFRYGRFFRRYICCCFYPKRVNSFGEQLVSDSDGSQLDEVERAVEKVELSNLNRGSFSRES